MSAPDRRSPRFAWISIAAMAAFLALRLPLMYRQPGGQDEDWYAVPGYTVASEGIPRIPYAPSRDPQSIFYRADEALFALPPAYFYWQAPFFLLFPPGYGTARLASAIAGLVAIWLVYEVGRQLYRDEATAVWAAGLYSISRVFYFPATFARPDMLCGTLGLGAILTTWHWQQSRNRKWLVASGGLLGLGMLTHPFAIVYCLQAGAWVVLAERGLRRRFASFFLLVACAVAVFSLWLPLILSYPDVFRGQFFSNVLDRTGPGLLQRFLVPWRSLGWQIQLLWDHSGTLQTILMTAGLLVATLLDARRGRTGPVIVLALAWSSYYLLAVTSGSHPAKGYLCYSGAFLMLCTGRSVVTAYRGLRTRLPHRGWWAWAGGVLLVAAMLPGAGVRTWVAHVRHWSDVEYNSPRFVQVMLDDLPADARYTVDPGYVFDFYLAGRQTILAVVFEFYFDAEDFPYDYLVAGPYALDAIEIPDQLDGRLVRTYGDPKDLFACYAEIYRPVMQDAGPEPVVGIR